MPRKRKTDLSRSTRHARASKIKRKNESATQIRMRRLKQAKRQAALRAAETPEERLERLARLAQQKATYRAGLKYKKTQARLKELTKQAQLETVENFKKLKAASRKEVKRRATRRSSSKPCEELESKDFNAIEEKPVCMPAQITIVNK